MSSHQPAVSQGYSLQLIRSQSTVCYISCFLIFAASRRVSGLWGADPGSGKIHRCSNQRSGQIRIGRTKRACSSGQGTKIIKPFFFLHRLCIFLLLQCCYCYYIFFVLTWKTETEIACAKLNEAKAIKLLNLKWNKNKLKLKLFFVFIFLCRWAPSLLMQ